MAVHASAAGIANRIRDIICPCVLPRTGCEEYGRCLAVCMFQPLECGKIPTGMSGTRPLEKIWDCKALIISSDL